MADIRFYPLVANPRQGILLVRGKPFPAAFWTPQEIKPLEKDGRR
jgi:hypothetical protein